MIVVLSLHRLLFGYSYPILFICFLLYICKITWFCWLFWVRQLLGFLSPPPLSTWFNLAFDWFHHLVAFLFYSSAAWFNWTLRLTYIYIYIYQCKLVAVLSWFVLVCFLLFAVWFLLSSLFYFSSIILLSW